MQEEGAEMAKGDGVWSAGTPNADRTEQALKERQAKEMRRDAGAAAGRGKRVI
jgi:hypothetical protein